MNAMKQRDPPKAPCKTETEVDKISKLPGHIIDKILSQLSLRDAARTSILSSKWRYKWSTLPHLVFDNQSILVSSQDQTAIKNRLVNIVDHVLLLHEGPIERFRLSHRDLQGVSDIDRWILFLSRGSVQEFVLEIWKGHRYKLPSSLYFFQNLVHLELFNCLLKTPVKFAGFKTLKSLDLQHITMEQNEFDYLISSCPLLERLTLMNFDGVTNLEIHAPNLLFFDIGGVFESVNFHDTCHLSIVSIGLYANAGFESNLTFGCSGNLIKFFAHLPRIHRLEVQSYFLKYLAAGKVPVRLPTPCMELSFLSLRINFNDYDENLAALCLLRSSPNLEELEMLGRPEEQNNYKAYEDLMEEGKDDCLFNHLQVVKVVGISGLKQELNFIKYLLAKSPVLEKITIKPAPIDGGWESLKELMKELLLLRRISVQAQVIYQDP